MRNSGQESIIKSIQRPVLDILLWCPACNAQHVDKPDADQTRTNAWKNPPHCSHLCQDCGHIWWPSDYYTNGVEAIFTFGKNDKSARPQGLFHGEAKGLVYAARLSGGNQGGAMAAQSFRSQASASWARCLPRWC